MTTVQEPPDDLPADLQDGGGPSRGGEITFRDRPGPSQAAGSGAKLAVALPHFRFGPSPDPLIALTPAGVICAASERATQMFACHARLMVGAHVGAFVAGLGEEGAERSVTTLMSVLALGSGEPVETIGYRLNGSSLPVEITSIVEKVGDARLLVCAIRDITHRKHSETALATAKETAERSNTAKLEFLGQLSHELRTPLAVIIGFSEVMRDEMFGPLGVKLYQTYAADICKSGRQLTDVVERIIDVTRLEGRMSVAHSRTADLSEVVERAMEDHAGKATIQGVRVNHNLRRGSIPVLLDDETLGNMIGHVIDNAIKYNRFGGRVEIRAITENAPDTDAARVRMTVSDNGPGIEREKLSRLRRSLDSNQEKTMGGLALCNAFLRLIGGQLSVESTANAGTTVTLLFPQRYDGRWRP